MRAHRQKKSKKNIFDEEEPQQTQAVNSQIKEQQVIKLEEQNANAQPQVSKSNKIIGRFEEISEPSMIKQNEVYIGKAPLQRRPTYENMQEIASFVHNTENTESRKKSSKIRERIKKKNLFEIDESEPDKQNIDVSNEDVIYIPADIRSQKMTKAKVQNGEEDENQKEEQKQQKEQDKFMIIQEEDGEEQGSNFKENIFNIEEQVQVKEQNQLTRTQNTSIALSKINIEIDSSQQEEKTNKSGKMSQKSSAKSLTQIKGIRKRSKSQNQNKKKVRINLKQESEQNNDQIVKLSKTLLKQQSLSLQQNAVSIRRLLYEPIKKESKLFFRLKRIKKSFSETYELYLDGNKEPILYCKNKMGSIGSNYYFSLTKEMNKNSLAFVGKLRGNVLGSEYTIYDSGLMPANNVQRKLWRATLGKIKYQSNFLGVNGPRKIQVFFPKPSTIEQLDSFKLTLEQQSVFTSSQACQKYRNKQPKWIKSHNSFGLNFGPRVKGASIKNFILIEDSVFVEEEGGENHLPHIVTFGKIKENIFSMEVCHPLSIVQAFGLCVSQFDRKISCQ